MVNGHKRLPFYYGWVIAISGTFVLAIGMGVVFNCFSQFIKPVCEDLGFTRRAMSLNQTLISMCQIPVALFWGQFIKRFKVKNIMLVSALICPTAFFAYSLVSNIWSFYFLSMLVGVSYTLVSVLPYTCIISNWFIEKRGLATGLCFMGSGLGGMLFNPLLSAWLIEYGWRRSFQILGSIMFVIMVVCVLLLKDRPEDMGLKPLGYENRKLSQDAPGELTGISYAQAKRSALFWAISLCGLGLNVSLTSMPQTSSPHLTDVGYTPAFAAGMVSISMGALSVGKILLGHLYDRFGIRRTSVMAIFTGLMGLTGIYFCQYRVALPFIVLGIGISCSFGTVANPIVLQALFGKKDFGAIMGLFTAISSIGTALCPLMNNMVYDMFESYRPAYVCWGVVVALVLLFFIWKLPDNTGCKENTEHGCQHAKPIG